MHKLLTEKLGQKMLLLGNEAIARAIFILNTVPMKKLPWKWRRQLPIPACAACA